MATEPEQIDSAEVVSRPCLVLFMILSVVLLIIFVLFLLLIISCLYLYRRKTVSFPCFQNASHPLSGSSMDAAIEQQR